MAEEEMRFRTTHRILRYYQRSDLEAKLNEMERENDGFARFQTVDLHPVVVGPDVVYIAHVVITEDVTDGGNDKS